MPNRTDSARITRAELELMNILWDRGASTVQMVVERLPEGRRLAYTTVQTMLNTLHRKSKVKRALDGRAYFYEAAVSRRRATGQALKEMVRNLFGGSPERLVLAMIETKQLTPADLAGLQRVMEEAERKAKPGNGEGS